MAYNFPIIMFDCSGSTEHDIDVKKSYPNVSNILSYEINIAQRIFKTKDISHAYVIMWNFTGRVCSKEPILISELNKIRMESLGGTCLVNGLQIIPDEWLQGNNKEIYIFTDGEIEDDNIVAEPLKKMINLGVTLQIITVEPNDINYIQTKADAGHKLFQAIKNNGLTKSVRRFSSYNEHHVLEPFISFDNPEEIEGFTPFQGEYFNINEQQDELIDKIEETIQTCETKEDIVKLAHDLTVTISHMTKDKSIDEITEINNQFADLFADSNIEPNMFMQVNNLLLLEANNQSNGNASSYHEFKDALVLYQ